MVRAFVWAALIVGGLLLAGPISEGVTGQGRIGLFLGGLLYLLPTIVAGLRRKVHPGGVLVVNVLLGWTVIGWIVALAMAASGNTTKDVVAVPPVPTPTVPTPMTPSTVPALQPVRRNATTRWFWWTVVGGLIIAILWIGSAMANTPTGVAPRAIAAATNVPATAAPHIGSVVRGGNWQYEVLKVDTAKTLRTGPYDFEVLTPKGVWIVVAVNLTNVGDRNYTLNDWDLELRDSRGITYDPAAFESLEYSHYLGRGALGEQMPPSVTVMVTLLFDVAPGTSGMHLHLVQGGPDIGLE